jgi:methyl-accepting chemotaxis protein
VQEIAAACKEQDIGAEQINKALQQLDQVIQQNASAAEEMAATTEELTGQSGQLMSALAFFHTGDESPRQAHRPKTVRSAAEANSGTSDRVGAKFISAAKTGVNLRLASADNALDAEFERY